MASRKRKAKSVVVQAGGRKVDAARKIFEKMDGKSRKEIIQKFIDDAGLTAAGASTYYQRFMKEAGNGRSGSSVRGRPKDEDSKAGKARVLFAKLHKEGATRKEVIAQYRKKLKLTEKGAATYYQTNKQALAA